MARTTQTWLGTTDRVARLDVIVTAQVAPRALRARDLLMPSAQRVAMASAVMHATGRGDPKRDTIGDEPLGAADRIKQDIYPTRWTIQGLGTHLPVHRPAQEKEPQQ